MKRRFAALALVLLALLSGCAVQAEDTVVVVSFYPVYVLTLNVTAGVDGVKVVCMADQTVGCLHDYALQTRDMAAIERANAMVINGGGMETFMDKVLQTRADLTVIDSSAGVTFLCEEPDGHRHEDGHDHTVNPHVWLDPSRAAQQTTRIAEGLAQADPVNAQAYLDNGAAYARRLLELDAELKEELAPLAGWKMITFHEAFAYMADAYGMDIVATIESDENGGEPGTREIAALCDMIRGSDVKTLFVEPQYPQRAAQIIARETGAAIYTLDPIVSGDGTPGSYERIMRQNAKTLKEAFFK